jgi:hypothetical protein
MDLFPPPSTPPLQLTSSSTLSDENSHFALQQKLLISRQIYYPSCVKSQGPTSLVMCINNLCIIKYLLLDFFRRSMEIFLYFPREIVPNSSTFRDANQRNSRERDSLHRAVEWEGSLKKRKSSAKKKSVRVSDTNYFFTQNNQKIFTTL